MTQKYSSFSYKAGKSFVHKIPSWIKILFIPAVSITVFHLPFYFSLALVFLQAVLAFSLHFTLKEQAEDLKFVLYFAVILYLMSFSGYFFSDLMKGENPEGSLRTALSVTFKNSASALMLLKLLCVMQFSSILFKTTTSLEIREGVSKIESKIRRILHLKEDGTVTDLISFTLYFIPLVFKIWSRLSRAWKARGGKEGPLMFLILLPALFSVGMKDAYTAAKAVMIRRA